MPTRKADREGASPAFKLHTRVPWATKLRPESRAKVVPDYRGHGTLLVPTPLLVAEEIRKIRRGHLITTAELRERLARRFGATSTCPFTTGIFLNIISGAAEEELAAGRRPTAPYWRVTGAGGRLNSKWPPGPERQARHLRAEGRHVGRDSATGEWVVKELGAL